MVVAHPVVIGQSVPGDNLLLSHLWHLKLMLFERVSKTFLSCPHTHITCFSKGEVIQSKSHLSHGSLAWELHECQAKETAKEKMGKRIGRGWEVRAACPR